MYVVRGATHSEVWPMVLGLFAAGHGIRAESRHGVTYDMPGLSVQVDNPADLTIPTDYLYPRLVSHSVARLFGDERDTSLLYSRLMRWAEPDGVLVDQINLIRQVLRDDPFTRTAVFTMWRGPDIKAEFPPSPVCGCFRMIDGGLILFVTARSSDVWIGLVPELVCFSRLLVDVAASIDVFPSYLLFSAWSAHVYEDDLIAYIRSLASKQ